MTHETTDKLIGCGFVVAVLAFYCLFIPWLTGVMYRAAVRAREQTPAHAGQEGAKKSRPEGGLSA